MSTPLALELYHLIIQHVHDQADLRALALCCSAFRDEAQRYLFRDIVPDSYDQRTKLISTINGAPLRFGRLVHKLQIRDGLVSNPDDPLVSKPLSLALHAMYNLKHLELYLWRPSTVLQRCTFSLRILVWHAMNGPEVSFLLRNFLPTQNHIKSLEIIHWEEFDAMEVPTNLCPDLDSLGVNDSRLVSILLPEARLISHFQWHGIYTPGTLTIRQLNHLESFKFYIAHSDSNTSFTQHMTSLIYLELEINVGSPPNLLPKILFLRNLPQLQVLILQTNYSYPNKWGDTYNPKFSVAFQRAFELCPSLKYIDVQEDRTGLKFDRIARPTVGIGGDLIWKKLVSVHADEVREWRL